LHSVKIHQKAPKGTKRHQKRVFAGDERDQR
jgi:hypothetical protein